MSPNLDNFLATLFEPGDLVCFTPDATGYRAYEYPSAGDLFFSVNSLLPEDSQPTKSWHSKDIARRADCNVARYQNFLLELDNMLLEDQYKYFSDLLPYTACTYSGGKSHHFIISLKESLGSTTGARIQYNILARRLHKLVSKADPTTKNPSRLSRLPFRIRPETGKEQKLIYLGEKVSYSELDSILPKLPKPRQPSAEETRTMVTPLLLSMVHEPDSTMQRLNLQSRNLAFYWLYCRCQELGLKLDTRQNFVDTMYTNLRHKEEFSLHEAYTAARLK